MSLQAKLDRLQTLKQQRKESQTLNKKAIVEQESGAIPENNRQKRKREEAQELAEQQQLIASGLDVTRVNNLKYTLEDNERWNAKMEEKEFKREKGFTDYTQITAKKYSKDIKEFQPDLELYEKNKEYRSADDMSYGHPDHKPTAKGVKKLVQVLENNQKKRGQFSRRRAYKDEDEVTFINERNMRFNKKVNRAYDKYTGEIKANFERGTAL